MDESYYHHHHHHHHHHGHDSSHENQGQQAHSQQQASSQGAVNSGSAAITEHRQQQHEATRTTGEQHGVTQPTIRVPIGALNISGNQTLHSGVQPTGSFHSVSSVDSSAEMSKYFPDPHATSASPFRHQQQGEGQVQSTATSNSVLYSNTNAFNAGPYVSVPSPFPVQRLPQPIRPPFMAQQGPFRPAQFPPGIPSYSSQIEGLSVSQAVVNDVLVDLQSKVINETLQQYQNESSSGNFLEPLPPIYIRAPQPTIILRSDLNRLRAELGNRVRPPVVFRNPGGANQFQQHRFQRNTFQVPRFPTPRQQHIPPECYGEHRNAAYANSDIHKTTTTGDEHRKENEERLYNQAESPVLNDDNVNDNVHSAFDLQGLSTTSFDRYASPYQSSFLPNLEEHQQQQQQQQQDNEETVLTTSDNINQEETDRTEDMFSRPDRPRPEITFDINNCIFRCFEAHRQRVARRRAARQARKAKRHRQSQQQQQQQRQQHQRLYNTDQYQNVPTQPIYPSFNATEQTQWQQQPQSSSSHYLDAIPCSTTTSSSVHTTQRPYIPPETYNYTGVGQPTSLPTDIQQYQSSDIINTTASHIPFSSLSSSSITTGLPTDIQSLKNDYYQFSNVNTQEPYLHSKAFEYNSHQTVPSTTDLFQQPSLEQKQTSYDYSNTMPYSSFSSVDATVPGEIQHLTSKYYQQQIPNQFIQPQGTYVQPSAAFQHTKETSQSQIPTYNYQNVKQQSSRYPYNIENIQQQPSFSYATAATTTYAPSDSDTLRSEQKQAFDYSSQSLGSSDYYQQQPTSVPVSQVQGVYGQPSGTFGYTGESYQSQQPIYNRQGIEKTSTQFPYNLQNIEQQHQAFDYPTGATAGYVPTGIDTHQIKEKQTFDYSSQPLSSSDYYQQQSTSIPVSQVQGVYGQPSGTFEYSRESYKSQQPSYDYQGVDQQSSQHPYNVDNIKQQHQSFDDTTGATAGYVPTGIDTHQIKEKQSFDYSSQPLSSSDYYQKQTTSVPVSQIQGSYGQPSGTFEYTRESYQSQQTSYDYQGADHQASQYPYNVDNIKQQHQSFDDTIGATAGYVPTGIDTHQTKEKQSFDYSSQPLGSSDYYQQQPTSVPVSQVQGAYGQPSGTFEYSRESYQSQKPIYNFQGADQQASQYPYNVDNIKQQHQSFDDTTGAPAGYVPTEIDTRQIKEKQTFDYASQPLSSSDYYQQRSTSIPASQVQGAYGQPSGTFEYSRESYQSQEPIYNYQDVDQQASQYPYNVDNIKQQHQSFDDTTGAAAGYVPTGIDTSQTEQKQTFDYSSQPLSSSDYYQQQTTSVPVSQIQGSYGQPSGTFEYTRESYQSQQPSYDYQGVDQQASQYPYNVDNIKQQHQSFDDTTEATAGYVPTRIDTHQTKEKQSFDYASQPLTSSDYYEQRSTSIPVSQVQAAYGQPSGTFEYSRESYQSQEPIYNYQGVDQQSSQYPYNVGDIQQQQQDSYNYDSITPSAFSLLQTDTQQTEEKQTFDYSSQPLSSSDYYQQQQQQQQLTSVPVTQVQEGYAQPSGTFEYTRESYQTQEPSYDYQGVDQQSSQYFDNGKGGQQQQQGTQPKQEKTVDYGSESAIAHAAPELDTQQTKAKQTIDSISQAVSSSDYNQQQPTSIPVSQVYDSQVTGQRLTGASVPTGTVEYTRQAYYSQEPSADNYTTENFIEQREQQKEKDKETMDVNDYLKRFESESNIISSYPQLIGGQTKSSGDRQSITTTTTTPFIIQQNLDTYPSQGAAQTYDLRNYTNECVVSEKPQPPIPSSSSVREEDQQHLLQQTVTTEKIHAPSHQPEQHSEIESSSYDTYSSLPPPPATEEFDQKQESSATNTSDFPPPPTPDRHTYQTTQQKPSSSFTSIIPTIDQSSIYTEGQPQPQPPLPDTHSDHETEEDSLENEEIFDLRRCIARCYAKYQDSWNKEEQQKYEKQLNDIQQPTEDATTTSNQQIGQYQQVYQPPTATSIPSYDQKIRQYQQPITTSIPPCSQQTGQYQQKTITSIPPYDQQIGQYQQLITTSIPPYDQQIGDYQQPITTSIPPCDQQIGDYQQAYQPPTARSIPSYGQQIGQYPQKTITSIPPYDQQIGQYQQKTITSIPPYDQQIEDYQEPITTSIPPCDQQIGDYQQVYQPSTTTSIPSYDQQIGQYQQKTITSIPPYDQQIGDYQEPITTSIPPCDQQIGDYQQVYQPPTTTSIPSYDQQIGQYQQKTITSIPPYDQQIGDYQEPITTSIPPCDQQIGDYQQVYQPPTTTSIPSYDQQIGEYQQPITTAIPPCSQEIGQYQQKTITSIPPYDQQIGDYQQPITTSIPPCDQQIGDYQQVYQPPTTTSIPSYDQQIGEYQQPITTAIPPCSQQFIQQSNVLLITNCNQSEQSRPYFGTEEIHYTDRWTQTPSANVKTRPNIVQHTHHQTSASFETTRPNIVQHTHHQTPASFETTRPNIVQHTHHQIPSANVTTRPNIVQHTYHQTPASFETTPCIPQVSTEDLPADSRGQQTIEYSPPLITQTRHVIPIISPPSPLPCYEGGIYEQQQQQPVYDHVLPVPPHLSFNDSEYQPHLYFSPHITAQPHQYENIPLDKYEEQQRHQQRFRAHSEPPSIQQDTVETISPIQPSPSQIFEQQPRRSFSIPMFHHQQQQQQQQQQPHTHMPPIRLLDNGRSYETDSLFTRRMPRIDSRTGLCLVPCPETRKYAHLPPHLRPELFCIELPPPCSLPPVPPSLHPPPLPPSVQQQEQQQQQQHQQRWCVRCCCNPGRSMIKKIVYKQVEDEKQHQEEESNYDYASVMDQMATRISVRYGNRIMEEGEAFIPGNYNEKLRVIDFPVYVSGKNDTNLTPLVPVN